MTRPLNTTWIKAGALLAFAVLACGYLGYLLVEASQESPFDPAPYTVSFNAADVDNAISPGDVKISGVTVGHVSSVTPAGGRAAVEVELDQQAVPLHGGATVRVGAKSLAGETYLDIHDGRGPALPSGARLPDSAVRRGVQLSDVVNSLDSPTRSSLRDLLRTAGAGTAGRQQDISGALSGLGDLGREGYTAIDAISAQSGDLTALAGQTTGVLGALNANHGQVATLVDEANQLTAATSAQHRNLADTIRKLPGTLQSTQRATGKLGELSGSLAPVAGDLREAAPHLTSALRNLPPATRDLRGLLPDATGTLQGAPDTLERVPQTARDISALAPQARAMMTQLNPMLRYLAPYGPEMGAFFANFGSIANYVDESGTHFFRLQPDLGSSGNLKGIPAKLPPLLLSNNPYPAPGASTARTGRPFTKLYPEPN
jgi:phospholipid/cholesterol/gamma-HCH transport system substrate-binding protein